MNDCVLEDGMYVKKYSEDCDRLRDFGDMIAALALQEDNISAPGYGTKGTAKKGEREMTGDFFLKLSMSSKSEEIILKIQGIKRNYFLFKRNLDARLASLGTYKKDQRNPALRQTNAK